MVDGVAHPRTREGHRFNSWASLGAFILSALIVVAVVFCVVLALGILAS